MSIVRAAGRDLGEKRHRAACTRARRRSFARATGRSVAKRESATSGGGVRTARKQRGDAVGIGFSARVAARQEWRKPCARCRPLPRPSGHRYLRDAQSPSRARNTSTRDEPSLAAAAEHAHAGCPLSSAASTPSMCLQVP